MPCAGPAHARREITSEPPTPVQSLLSDPNPNSPANSEAAKLFTEDR